MRRIDLAEEPLDLDGVDGVFHLAAQAGVRSFGDVFPLYVRRNLIATQRVLEACVEADVRVVLASSSSIYGEAEAYPTPEDTQPRPISPYGITKLGCEQLAYAYRADAVVLRYFTVYGPRQRPDMFFRRVCEALLAGEHVRDLRHRRAVAQLHVRRRRGRRDRSRRWSARRRERSTTSAAETRRACSRRSSCSSRSPAESSTSGTSASHRATSRGRRRTSRASARRSAGSRETSLARRVGGDVVVGLG